jgi:hypothetical protein
LIMFLFICFTNSKYTREMKLMATNGPRSG